MFSIKRVLFVTLAASAFSVASFADDDVEEKYNKSCTTCHAAGIAGAPKTGDVEAWKPRMDKGMDALVASVNNGLNAMPPKGMCMDCSDDDYKALIEYMATAK